MRARRGEAVHDRHLAVHQHGIEMRFGKALQRFGAVVGDGDLGGQILQQPLRHALIDRIVLDQEDPMAAERRRPLRRATTVFGACGVLPVRTWSTRFASLRRGSASRPIASGRYVAVGSAAWSAPNSDSSMKGSGA